MNSHYLFCHKPYGFPMRAIYLPVNLLPMSVKVEFDTIYQIEEGVKIIDEKLLNLIQKWKLYADDSPTHDDILFPTKLGSDEPLYPKWFKESLTYYQNESRNRNDMYESPKTIYQDLKSKNIYKGHQMVVIKSIIVVEKEEIYPVIYK